MHFLLGMEILVLQLVIGNVIGQDPVLSISTAKLPSGRDAVAAVYDGDDTIYILGGRLDASNLPTESILKFSITSEKLESIAVLPEKSFGASAIWDGTGVVYFGGYKAGSMPRIDAINRYIPGKSFAQTAGTLPRATYHSIIPSFNDFGETYIFGGGALGSGNKIVKYSKITNLATDVNDVRLPYEMQDASSIHYSNSIEDLIFIFGGYNSGGLDSIIQYDVATGFSSILPQTLPYPVNGSGAFYNGTYAYIIGGYPANNVTNLIRFNPLNKEVLTLNVNNFPNQLYGFGFVFVKKLNRAYFFGGRIGNEFMDQIMYLTF